VFAVKGGVESVVRQVAAAAGNALDSGKDLNEVADGSEMKDVVNRPFSGDNPANNTRASNKPPVPVWVFGVIGGLILVIGSGIVWFEVLQPRRKARPLLDAVQLLSGGGDAALAKAAALPSAALHAGLKPEYLAET